MTKLKRPLFFSTRFAKGLLQLVLFGVLFIAGKAFGHDFTAGDLQIQHPWARPTPPGTPNGAAYFTIVNAGQDDDVLLDVHTEVAEKAEIHTHLERDGVMSMQALSQLDIAAGQTAHFRPGGLHVMLLGLRAPLKPAESFPLRLVFKRAGMVTVSVIVEAQSEPMQPHAH